MNELLCLRKGVSSPPLNPSPYSKIHTVRKGKIICVLTLRDKNLRTLCLFYILIVVSTKAGFVEH